MPKIHGGLPPVWLDALGPVFGQAAGAASPSDAVLATASPTDTTMDVHALNFNAATNDRQYCSVQVQHDLLLPPTGDVIFKPHVHFTFLSAPTVGETVRWKIAYVYAKPGISTGSAGRFAAAPTILSANTYTVAGADEARYHLIAPAGDVVIPVADCGPSMVFMYTLKLDSASTIASGKVAGLYVDWHYQAGPVGTDGEFS